MASSGSPVQSIDRVFDIIEVLSSSPHGMILSELAAEVNLHISTTHRLLSSLSARGYVQKDIESGKYRLTTKLFEVGSRVVGGMNLLSVSRPYLEHLANATSETIHLVARNGDEVVYLYKEDTSSSTIRMASMVGQRAPMYCTGVGKSILAYLPEQEVRDIWGRIQVTPFTAATHVTLEDLLADLAQVRQRGYAMDNEEHEPGVFCVGAPILDFGNRPVGAVSISAPAARVDLEKRKSFALAAVSSANAVTILLGGTPPTPSL